MILIQFVNNAGIADTVAAVFRERAFAEYRSVSIGQLIAQWVWHVIEVVLGFTATHPVIGFIVRLALGLCLLFLLARIVFGLLARYAPSASGFSRFSAGRSTDWWNAAQDLAEHGDYTGAAHALYLALIGSAARRGLVSLHESKTTGDYLRELRRKKPDVFDLSRFTDFTRSYETVIYGVGTCDRERYTALNALAGSILTAVSGSQSVHAAAYGATTRSTTS